MAIVIVADVHANLAAFDAVLGDAGRRGSIDAIWCLGDIVGYGPQPNECVALLRSYPHVAVAGNHDLAAIGAIDTEYFNDAAAAAATWTARQLGAAERDFLAALPLGLEVGAFTLVHGSLKDPVWEYLVSVAVAADHLAMQSTAYGLVGHSHLPVTFRGAAAEPVSLEAGDSLALNGDRFVANPGGLGQPRDGDPRAAYAHLDLEAATLTFHRVEYDIGATQAKMRDVGLPLSLIERLSRGR